MQNKVAAFLLNQVDYFSRICPKNVIKICVWLKYILATYLKVKWCTERAAVKPALKVTCI
jgi:UDP:flavonoid glycosyltransferase YjiC (YdhE family)